MSEPTIKKIWINRHEESEHMELRLDWDNDRHHAVSIYPPGGRDQISRAFKDMQYVILNDKELNG